MKKEIHPDNYRLVIFKDTASGERFLVGSTVETTETDKWEDGKEYPFYEIEISSASHPFYTGQDKVLDTTGRVERFKQRREKAQAASPSSKKVKKEAKKKAKEEKEAEQSSAHSSEGSISVASDARS
ncbi:MAG: type B 50S ribosomal protein L31 [Candidatus Paceibacterota bacterium]